MKPLKERLANVLRTKIFMGDKHNSYENIVEALLKEVNMNGDEMKDQIGKDMAKIALYAWIAVVIAILGAITSVVLILSRGVCL